MYFVNMCGEEGVKTFRAINEIPFINKDTETREGYITIKDGKLVVDTTGHSLFEKGIISSDEAYLPELKTGLTCKDIVETEENPLIIVLCDYIEVFDKVPADIKFIHLDEDKVLAMLVHGVCSFNGVPMFRCCNTDIDNKSSKRLRSADLKNITNSVDKESGYNYLMDAVFQLYIKFTDSSSGPCIGGKLCLSGTENFNTKRMEHYRERMQVIERKREAKRLQEEVEKKLRRERMEEEKRLMEEERKKAEEEAHKAELEKALKKANAKPKKQQETEVNVGAKEFLAALGIH